MTVSRLWLAILAVLALSLGVAKVADAQVYGIEPSDFRNVLVCGDLSVCPNQRGTSSIGGNIANTSTMTADFWDCEGGASSSLNVSVAAPTTPMQGFSKALEMQRTAANSNTAALHCGQVLDTDRSTALQGQYVVYSFYAEAAANFSAANSALNYTLYTGTGTAQGYNAMLNTPWTGSAQPINTCNGDGVTSLSSGVCTATLTTTPQRFWGVAPIGAATEIGIDFNWTPSGNAGAADAPFIWGIQLEAVVPAPGQLAYALKPTSFEHHSAAQELRDALRRAYVINEPAANVNVGTGMSTTTTSCWMQIPFPVPMRAAPTLTASTITGGTTWNLEAVATGYNITAIATYTANSIFEANIAITNAAVGTAGYPCVLQGKGGGANLTWSADLT